MPTLWKVLSIFICVSCDQFKQSILRNSSCGDAISGYLSSSSEANYIYFNLTSVTNHLLFDSCLSLYDTYLYLLDINGTILYEGDDDGACDNKEQLLITSTINPGLYILKISGYGNVTSHAYGHWRISISCHEPIPNSRYLLPLGESAYPTDWLSAELYCEVNYGTTLATVVTEEDISIVRDIIIQNYLWDGYHAGLWIGMYHDVFNNTKLRFIDGTPCNYTESGYWEDEIHWTSDTDYNESVNKFIDPLYAYINTSLDLFDDILLPIFAYFDHPHTGVYGIWNEGRFGFLCNDPNGKYGNISRNNKYLPKCNGNQCWNMMECCDELELLRKHDNQNVYGIAYWNSSLFVIGHTKIYYTTLTLHNTNYDWHNISYNDRYYNDTLYIIDVAQYRSSLYILAMSTVTSESDITDNYINLDMYSWYSSSLLYYQNMVFQIDLNNPMDGSDSILMDQFMYGATTDPLASSDFMIVAKNKLFIVTESGILIYEDNKYGVPEWHRAAASLNGIFIGDDFLFSNKRTPTGGILTQFEDFIYIFTGQDEEIIWKYDIEWDEISQLNDSGSNICFNKDISGITAPNGDMYIHNCYLNWWKTAIFDTDAKEFKTSSIDIDNPMNTMHYKQNHMTVFDDNILLLYSMPLFVSDDPTLYFMITNNISINVSNTITKLWPSDGILFEYYLNDFSDNMVGEYPLQLDCYGTTQTISEIIIMNVSSDECICNGYNCHGCRQHFNLSNHITSADNDIDQITCNLSPQHSSMNILILPADDTIIEFQRCVILLSNANPVTNNDRPIVQFNYTLNKLCHSKSGVNYSISISSEEANIVKSMILNVCNNNTNMVWICEAYECAEFHNNSFEFRHSIFKDDKMFNIDFTSNSIDANVNASSRKFSVNYYHKKTTQKWDKRYWYFLLLLLIPILIVWYVYLKVRKKYEEAFQVEKALVLIIGISQFEDKRWYLKGVESSVPKLKKLWKNKYKYDVFVCNEDILWSDRDQVIDFIDNHKAKLQFDIYQCVIVHVLSHGVGNGEAFATSDKRKMNVELMMRELTEYAHNGEQLIKITFNHTCRGEANYDQGETVRGPKDGDLQDEDNEKEENDIVHYDNSPEISNRVIIWATVDGRVVSDAGYFTNWICKEFEDNVDKWWWRKDYFKSLITNIRVNVKRETNGTHVSEITDTLTYKNIVFSQWEEKRNVLKKKNKYISNKNEEMACELLAIQNE
eukprot:246685_1